MKLTGICSSATRQIIANQRAHICKLEAMGVSAAEAEQNLNMFLDTLRMLEDHERWVAKISNQKRPQFRVE